MMIKEFDSLNCPLEKFNLVEAAAGTGKTYNIQNLFARLIIECGIPVERILVVTYTNAAAAELGDRIRNILHRLRDPEPDSREAALLEAVYARGVDPATAAERLNHALLQFDEAVISTIHGFCRKVLSENAFAGGILFDCELEKESTSRILPLACDFYRRNFYRSDTALLRNLFAADPELSPEALAGIAAKKIANPELHLKTGVPETETAESVLCRLAERIAAFAALPFPEDWEMLDEIMKKDSQLEALAPHLKTLRHFRDSGGTALDAKFPAALRAVIPETLRGTLNKRGKNAAAERAARLELFLQQPFFNAAETVQRLFESYPALLKKEAATEIAAAFEEEKRRCNFQTFDDLPRRVHTALLDSASPLRHTLQERYMAGIIDEFQDTDALQYEIFSSIFDRAGSPPLFLVGDPRQAIYGFRGGDIAAYRRAKAEIAAGGCEYTLLTNYRSAANMIDSVNVLFAEHRLPFADPAIPFPPVNAPCRRKPGMLYQGNEAGQPLSIVELPEANAGILRKTAAQQILAMLNDPAWQLPGEPPRSLRPGDFAVLLFNGYEAESMKSELNALGIPAVFSRAGNVFASADAAELRLVLESAADPGNAAKLVRALETPLCGIPLEKLIAFQSGSGMEEFITYQTHFYEFYRIWLEDSFLAMFGAMQKIFRIRSRYPALPSGERKLTNLLQLGDLLQQESLKNPAPQTLLAAFTRRISDSDSTGNEEFEQLLETDRNAVKLMTIHGSKGLEFPVVILPNLAARDAADTSRRSPYHRSDGAWEFDLGNDPESRRLASQENFQELLRLAYVALTRAKYRSLVLLGKKHGPLTAPAWLLGAREAELTDAGTPLPVPEKLQGTLLPESGHIYLPETPEELLPELPVPHLKIEENWRIASYSRLTPHLDPERLFDYDDDEPELEGGADSDNAILALPGGTATGNAWHRILEKLDFTAPENDIAFLTRIHLQNCGLLNTEEQLRLTTELMCRTLRTPLTDCTNVCFTLDTIAASDRLNELEFHYRFRRAFDSGMLKSLLAEYAEKRFGLTEWPEWSASISGGYLNGFIDLIFRHHGKYFIADWKSNRLGGKLRNFEPEHLPDAMRDSFYFLQYLFYTVALVKYLRLKFGTFGKKEYETQFGGVFYLFLRGLSPEHPGRGVFYEKAEYHLIEALEEVIG